MDFRGRLEEIMTQANLLQDEKETLVERLTPLVLSRSGTAIFNEKSVEAILNKIDYAGLYKKLEKQLIEKEKSLNTTPTDNLDDESITMVF